MGTKMAVAFANIFMGNVETDRILSQSAFKPLVWKRYIEDIFSLWTINRDEIKQFIEQANNHHPTIKFTAEISERETTFLDTSIRFQTTQSWRCVLISSLLRRFNTLISVRLTHRELKKASSKGRL